MNSTIAAARKGTGRGGVGERKPQINGAIRLIELLRILPDLLIGDGVDAVIATTLLRRLRADGRRPGAYKPVRAEAVALALVRTVATAQGLQILPSDVLARLGAEQG